MQVAVYAILWAAACFVPMDPTFPAVRMRHMMKHCGAKALLLDVASSHSETLQEVISGFEGVVLQASWDGYHLMLAQRKVAGVWVCTPRSAQPAPEDSLDMPAWLLYTSGSTGKPKGVLMSHRAAAGNERELNCLFLVELRAPFCPTTRTYSMV